MWQSTSVFPVLRYIVITMLRWTEGAKPGKVVKRKRTATDDVIEEKRFFFC